MMMSMNGRSRNPFTASQWQELEHQALAYKYMITGMPIPPDLLFSIKTSFTSSISSNFLLHQATQHFGWSNGFQIGYGKKIDPEPGRCRRTDGKKWRCSKEASSDSKYCERHMHRGRNRSRKPVEINTSITSENTIAPKTTHSSSSNFLYPHFSASDSLEIALSSHENSTSSFFLDSNAYSTKDYRKSYGQEMNEHSFFTEASSTNYGTRRNDCSWQLAPLTMGSPLSQMKTNSYSGLQSEKQNYYSYNSERHIERDNDEPKKVMHHFLDEYVPKEDMISTERTQLSISTPNSVHDFFITQK